MPDAAGPSAGRPDPRPAPGGWRRAVAGVVTGALWGGFLARLLRRGRTRSRR